MQLSRLRQHLVSVEEAYDAEALRARQREDTLRQDTLRQDTLRQATVKLLSNNSQSHLAESQSAEPCLRLRWRWEESLGGGVAPSRGVNAVNFDGGQSTKEGQGEYWG